MPEKCPICTEDLKDSEPGESYICPRCGRFMMSDHTKALLPMFLTDRGDGQDTEEKIAIVSHAIRRLPEQKGKYWRVIDDQWIEAILKNPLPKLTEQADNLIIWFAENVSAGEQVYTKSLTHQSIIGSKSEKEFGLVLKYLFGRGLLEGSLSKEIGTHGEGHTKLSFTGWQYYEELRKGAIKSKKAFMAMEYNDSELDKVVDDCFRPAVVATGFELSKLDDEPRAGLIDDRLRVEIRNSRFLISDLTHENSGAYWEAGYAEGLGKPVIYTCKKEVFENNKPHFDTNHHLTVIWNTANLQEAANELKATIRATLPDEAKLDDDS